MTADVVDDGGSVFGGGVVLFAGGVDFENLARRGPPAKGKKAAADGVSEERAQFYQDLLSPHRLASLSEVVVRFIASGPAASHLFAVDINGDAYAWGRNLEGQLGLGDRVQRNQPTKVPDIHNVVSVSCGRAHSSFVLADGTAMSCGDNKFGQLGTGSDVDQVATPVRVALSKAVKMVACGADFTMWLSQEGNLYAAGSGENGALGDGSTHTFNTKSSSIKMEIEAQPRPRHVPGIPKDSVVNVACGINHTICLTDDGSVYSWGCGDYGRLGHEVQRDELRPRQIGTFTSNRAVPVDAVMACGGTCSIISSQHGIYWWGKVKPSGDAMMTPTMCYDLRGWELRSLSAGKATFGVAAESSCILWGNATHGELAGGPYGRKTSASPAKCSPLEGLITQQVVCGNGFTAFLMDTSHAKTNETVDGFAVYEAPAQDPFAASPPSPTKPKAKPSRKPGKRKRGSD
ncbi:Regulator of chromosome condensation [Plasmodiophora brassicae]